MVKTPYCNSARFFPLWMFFITRFCVAGDLAFELRKYCFWVACAYSFPFHSQELDHRTFDFRRMKRSSRYLVSVSDCPIFPAGLYAMFAVSSLMQFSWGWSQRNRELTHLLHVEDTRCMISLRHFCCVRDMFSFVAFFISIFFAHDCSQPVIATCEGVLSICCLWLRRCG